MYEGYKVKILTMIGKPKGTVVVAGFVEGSTSAVLYQVRLGNGMIIKDLRDHEVEFIRSKKQIKNK